MAKKAKKALKVVIPALIETESFTPTQIQIKFAYAYARELKLSPTALLKKLGHSAALWTQWRENMNFRPWLESVVKSYMKTTALADVWKAIYASAISKEAKGSPDRKLFLELFCSDYRPASKLEIEGKAGLRPPDKAAIDHSEAMRKAIDCKEVDP